MVAEIELKAHVKELDVILSNIRNTLGVSQECFQEKRDIYLTNRISEPSVRCRLEKKGLDKNDLKSTLIITAKNKLSKNGIEENEEFEIESEGKNFETSVEMFKALGYKITLLKEKSGYSFMYDQFIFPLHIEVLDVKPLGWFLEMEFTVEKKLSYEEVENLKKDLIAALHMFGLQETDIEKRYYRDMLNEQRGMNYGI